MLFGSPSYGMGLPTLQLILPLRWLSEKTLSYINYQFKCFVIKSGWQSKLIVPGENADIDKNIPLYCITWIQNRDPLESNKIFVVKFSLERANLYPKMRGPKEQIQVSPLVHCTIPLLLNYGLFRLSHKCLLPRYSVDELDYWYKLRSPCPRELTG